jgi:hypothetical protein
MKENKYYVTTTDKFMSGWGYAKNKINKLVFECNSFQEAEIVIRNASNRSDQKNCNICSKKPYYNTNKYFTQYKTIKDYPKWYTPGAF